MLCPECRERIGVGETTCECGWYLKTDPADFEVAPELPLEPPPQRPAKPGMSYRERWYAARGLPYEPPKPSGSFNPRS